MASKPPSFEMPQGEYAGDVSCADAWHALSEDPAAVLVDVRTHIEWQLIGRPDLSSIGKEPVYVQWITMQGRNPAFLDELEAKERAAEEFELAAEFAALEQPPSDPL